MKLAIYSSGSVDAQRLLLQYVDAGEPHGGDAVSGSMHGTRTRKTRDIRSLFAGYFDTVNAGPKMEAGSYEKIVESLNTAKALDYSKVLFLSDNVKGENGCISLLS